MNWLHFLAMQHYIPEYQVAWSGTAVETWWFRFVLLRFLRIPLPFARCGQQAALPGERTPMSGFLLRPGGAACQGEAQSDPLDPQE